MKINRPSFYIIVVWMSLPLATGIPISNSASKDAEGSGPLGLTSLPIIGTLLGTVLGVLSPQATTGQSTTSSDVPPAPVASTPLSAISNVDQGTSTMAPTTSADPIAADTNLPSSSLLQSASLSNITDPTTSADPGAVDTTISSSSLFQSASLSSVIDPTTSGEPPISQNTPFADRALPTQAPDDISKVLPTSVPQEVGIMAGDVGLIG